MAHQGGKLEDEKERAEMYDWLDNLEFNLLELPKPDIAIFLHMPTEKAQILKANRTNELPDGHEKDINHLKQAEKAYIELAKKYNIHTVECTNNGNIRTIEDINEDVYNYVINKLSL